MKILFVTDYFQPNLPYSKEILALVLQELGHTVQVCTSNRYFPFPFYETTAQPVLGNRIQHTGTHVENTIVVNRNATVFEVFGRVYFTGIVEHIASFHPDAIFVFGAASPSAVQVASLAPKVSAKIIMFDSHLPSELMRGNALVLQLKRILYGVFRFFFASNISQAADVLIAQQDDTVQVIKHTYGLTAPVIVVPNGTDIKLFYFDRKSGKQMRRSLGIRPNDFVLLYTGKITEAKGVEILMQAFSQFHSKHPDSWCVLAGEGPLQYKEHCLSLLSDTARKQCIFLGFRKSAELRAYYSMSDVAVWPLQDSFAMNDAAACELVFIANDTLGDKTRISNNNALLYKVGNVSDLVSKLSYLYDQPTERKLMGKRGRKLVTTKLSWDILARRIVALCADVNYDS